MRRLAIAAGAALCLAGSLALSAPAGAQYFYPEVPCDRTVPERLSALGVGPADIEKSLTEEIWGFSDLGDVFRGWTVWMDLKSCKGQLVVRLSTTCAVTTVYTTGACSLKGAYRSD